MLFLIILNYLVRSGRLKPSVLLKWKSKILSLKTIKILPILLFLLVFNSTIGSSTVRFSKDKQTLLLPIPHGIENQLFYLQRDPDANTVIYQLNIKNGLLDNKNPVHAFWIRYAEGGNKKELTAIQKKLAYGIHTKTVNSNTHELRLVSYPSLPLYLVYEKNRPYVYTILQDAKIILERIYVKTDGSKLFPTVYYIDLFGKEPNGKTLRKRIWIKDNNDVV